MEDGKVEDLLLSLPRALRLLRESRGLGQDDLDSLTAERNEKVGRASIARYEGGKRSPSLESLRRLMGALDVTWDELGRALAAARRGDTKRFHYIAERPEVSSRLLKREGPSMKLVVDLGDAEPESVAESLRRVLNIPEPVDRTDSPRGRPIRARQSRGQE